MATILFAWLGINLAFGLVATFISARAAHYDPVKDGILWAIIWPGALVALAFLAPFWLAERAGEWSREIERRNPQ